MGKKNDITESFDALGIQVPDAQEMVAPPGNFVQKLVAGTNSHRLSTDEQRNRECTAEIARRKTAFPGRPARH